MRFGLLAKLTLPAVALAVLGLGVTTAIGFSKSRAAIEAVVYEQQLQAAESVAQNAAEAAGIEIPYSLIETATTVME